MGAHIYRGRGYAVRAFASLFLLLVFSLPVVSEVDDHEWAGQQHEWIAKQKNSRGQSCCGVKDTFLLTHEEANSLQIGDVIWVNTRHGRRTVKVDRIFPTEDPQGRPWITSFGCLFIAQGT